MTILLLIDSTHCETGSSSPDGTLIVAFFALLTSIVAIIISSYQSSVNRRHTSNERVRQYFIEKLESSFLKRFVDGPAFNTVPDLTVYLGNLDPVAASFQITFGKDSKPWEEIKLGVQSWVKYINANSNSPSKGKAAREVSLRFSNALVEMKDVKPLRKKKRSGEVVRLADGIEQQFS